MSKYRQYGPDRSNSNQFYSDENLNWEPAGYADFAPLPGEDMSRALADSAALRAHQAAGGSMTPLPLAEIEIDDGGTSADNAFAATYNEPGVYEPALPHPLPPVYQQPAPLADDRIDRIEQTLERLTNLLLGGQ